jgi:hypothetical protein
MSNLDLAKMTGLSRSTICKLSQLDRWDSVSAGVMQRFSIACGVDLLAPGDQKKFIARSRLDYMDRTSPAQRRMMKRIISDLKGGAPCRTSF